MEMKFLVQELQFENQCPREILVYIPPVTYYNVPKYKWQTMVKPNTHQNVHRLKMCTIRAITYYIAGKVAQVSIHTVSIQ